MWVPQLMVPIGGGLLVVASLAALWQAWRRPDEVQARPEVARGIE
jgi:hypothetical protein